MTVRSVRERDSLTNWTKKVAGESRASTRLVSSPPITVPVVLCPLKGCQLNKALLFHNKLLSGYWRTILCSDVQSRTPTGQVVESTLWDHANVPHKLLTASSHCFWTRFLNALSAIIRDYFIDHYPTISFVVWRCLPNNKDNVQQGLAS